MPRKKIEQVEQKEKQVDANVQMVEQHIAKRGSKSASIEATTTAKKEEISAAIMASYQYFKRPPVKSDEECAERLNEYFAHCYETGEIPTVENMSLALGTVRQTVWDWEQGKKGAERADMIKKAKQILAGIDATLVSQNKIPQVTYIFRAKNFWGMSDQQELVITPNNPLGEQINQRELESRIADVVVEQDAEPDQ